MAKKLKTNSGFLLVELIVAIFIFSLVMAISIGSIITLLDANRKTQALKSVLNNLNIALDTMTKTMAVGKDYDCGTIGGAKDCPLGITSGDNQMTFESNEDLNSTPGLDLITYSLQTDASGGYIERKIDSLSPTRMTAPEINVTKLKFFVSGTAPFNCGSDTEQPKVAIWVQGQTRTLPRVDKTKFNVQTIVSQRIADNFCNQ